ncbi:MAG: Mur ligase family protein [Syntrophomonadaceae bacterium]
MSKATAGMAARRGPRYPDPAIIRGMIASILETGRPGYRPSPRPSRLVFKFIQPGRERLRRGRHLNIRQPNLGLIMKAGRSRTWFVNADDPNIRGLEAEKLDGGMVTIGLINEADYMAFNVGGTRRAWEFFVELRGRDEIFLINFTGDRNVYNALFAIAVADWLGFTPGQIRRGLRKFRRPRSGCF